MLYAGRGWQLKKDVPVAHKYENCHEGNIYANNTQRKERGRASGFPGQLGGET